MNHLKTTTTITKVMSHYQHLMIKLTKIKEDKFFESNFDF
jgi:hypothetical protein